MGDSLTWLYNCVLRHMGNTVSLPLFQEKKKSGYGHLPYFLLKLHQALIKNVLFVEPEIIPRRHLCLCDGDAHHGQEISNFQAKPEVSSKFLHWQLLHVKNSHLNRIWNHNCMQQCVRENSTWQRGNRSPHPTEAKMPQHNMLLEKKGLLSKTKTQCITNHFNKKEGEEWPLNSIIFAKLCKIIFNHTYS